MSSLIRDDCEGCAGIKKAIQQTYANGGHVEEQGWVVKTIYPLPNPPKNLAFDYYDVVIQQLPGKLFKNATAQPSIFPGNPRTTIAFGLLFADGGWKVTRLIPQVDQ